MKAKDLTPYMKFKLPGKRKFRYVKKIIPLVAKVGFVPERHNGKILIIYEDCMQHVLDPEQEVIQYNTVN